MDKNVVDKALKKCRDALLGGIPVLYIKTDNDFFINKLIFSKTDPLVVLLNLKKEPFKGRPLISLPDDIVNEAEYNVRFIDLMSADSANNYTSTDHIKLSSYSTKNKERVYVPTVWTLKVPNTNDAWLASKVTDLVSCYIERYEDRTAVNNPLYRSSALILYSSEVPAWFSSFIRKYTEFIDLEYPEDDEIQEIIKNEAGGDKNLIGDSMYLNSLGTEFLGFDEFEIRLILKRIMALSSFEGYEDRLKNTKIIAERKRQKLQGGLLKYIDYSDANVAGMEAFVEWIEKKAELLNNSATYRESFGVPPPKGVLLCGIPGCGKSEAAKAAAKTIGRPLLRMDIGSIMDKWQGGSEEKMNNTISLVESMAPCILWIDELEKGFSEAGNSQSGNGTFKRMFGTLLTWMQENEKPCFIFATANDIGALPKEFFRSGRFDELFAVYLPTAKECASVFVASLRRAQDRIKKTGRNSKFNNSLMKEELYLKIMEKQVRTDGRPKIMIGSDIQKAVNAALTYLASTTGDISHITDKQWKNALETTLSSESFGVYGDGEENVNSIAVSYCRLLRKSFLSSSKDSLFNRESYHPENAEQYGVIQRRYLNEKDEQKKKELEEELKNFEIYRENINMENRNEYDKAVYSYLKERINKFAVDIERSALNSMIGQ